MDSIKSLLFKKGPDCLDSGGFGWHVGQSNTELQRQVSSPDPESDMIAAVSKLIARDTVFYIFGKEEPYSSSAQRYQETMRNVVNLLSTGKHATFMRLVNQMPFSEINGYQTLFSIADALFEGDDVNWGRITALYAFCAWAAKSSGKIELAEVIISFLGYYVSRKIGSWIKGNGGWVSTCNEIV